MAEVFTGIWGWDSGLPLGTAKLSQADDQLRGIKNAIEDSFPGITGPVATTHDRLNSLVDYVHTGPTVEARLAALETLSVEVTPEELATLNGIDTSLTIESRFDAVAAWIGAVQTEELAGLAGYIIGNGTIESRLQILLDAINSISGGGPSNADLAAAIDANTAWIAGRAGVSTDAQIASVSTFHNTAMPSGEGYSVNDLGQNIQLLAQKMETAEDILGTGGSGSIVWENIVTGLDVGRGGINVSALAGSTNKWGALLLGLQPGSNVDHRYYASGGWGNWASVVNANKVRQVSPSGWCHMTMNVDSNGWGPGGAQLPHSGSGKVQVQGIARDGGTVTQDIYCEYNNT